uniref:Cation/H+ exchanger transmembrane domain-containing protein n=1 Tax=Pygocentrus nattereri TaxID=42514 RepID=A0AAR2IXE3_PYGNA
MDGWILAHFTKCCTTFPSIHFSVMCYLTLLPQQWDGLKLALTFFCCVVSMAALLFGVVWSITEKECLPGGNLFGIVTVFICALTGGKLVGLIHIPNLPPIPPLLGMLLAGVLLRNIPVVTEAVYIDFRWSASLRNIALAVILARAGLGLDGSALKKLKAVCVRVAMGPCLIEASTVALVSHFLMGLPWIWGFILGFVLGAVSPAVVVPSMLLLQKDGYGLEQGVPTLLMAAGSFDDILAITGFTTCLGIAFATGSTWFNILRGGLEVLGGMVAGLAFGFFLHYFPSKDQKDLAVKRSFLLLGLSVFAVFGSNVVGIPGSGGLCTLVLSFVAGVGWRKAKAPVEEIVGKAWDVFQPLLFGLIGAEITISALDPRTVGLGLAALCIALTVRIFFTFLMVLCAGFNFKEKLFIALAWMPKATVQAAIGSTALDMARSKQEKQMEQYGMDVLTVAVLSILLTAPIGALLIGLCGPRLLQRPKNPEWGETLPLGHANTYMHIFA